MDIRQEIAKQVEQLPPAMQEQVLRFVTSLATASPAGEQGAALHQFSNSLDSISARQMREAIERGCEQVDSSQW
jgi:hypothetical protein